MPEKLNLQFRIAVGTSKTGRKYYSWRRLEKRKGELDRTAERIFASGYLFGVRVAFELLKYTFDVSCYIRN